jgi:very-short-patch-repair endonuclease
MRPEPELFLTSQQGLMTAPELRRTGVPRASLSRAVGAGDVLRIRRSVYGLVPLDALPRFVVTDAGVAPEYVRHVRAVLMSLGPRATACGRTAAALRGWAMLVEPSRTVEIAVPHGRGRSGGPGTRVTQRRRLRRERVAVLPGTAAMWLSTAVQTVIDCSLTLPLIEAVVICDSALRAGDVTLSELRIAARRLNGVRQARQVRRVLRQADPQSGSVLESVLRVKMVKAGSTGFASQVVVSSLNSSPRVDFCFAAARLVVEADGVKWHQDPKQDRARDNALACAGYRVLRYTWHDIVHDSRRVLDEIQMALGGTERIQNVTRQNQAAA